MREVKLTPQMMTKNGWMMYRHKGDDSILYEVRPAEANAGRYEVRRADRTDIFGSEPFVMDSADWEAIYEPVPEEKRTT